MKTARVDEEYKLKFQASLNKDLKEISILFEEDNGTPPQYSCLENPMDGGAWQAAVQWGHKESDTTERIYFTFCKSIASIIFYLDFTFTFHFHALEKEMATHSSVLAWRIPGTGEAWWAAVYGVAQSRI